MLKRFGLIAALAVSLLSSPALGQQYLDQATITQSVTGSDSVLVLKSGGPNGHKSINQASVVSLGLPSSRLPQPPSSGSWVAGQWVQNSAPTPGTPFGWVCVVSGTPGTWSPFGNIGSSVDVAPQTYSLQVLSPSNGSSVSGIVPIQVQTSGMADVEIYNGTAFLTHSATAAGGVTTVQLDTTPLQNGSDTLTIKAQDTAYGTTPAHTATPVTLTLNVTNGSGNVSAAGTTVFAGQSGQQITDAKGNVWTIQSSQAFENGAAAGFSASVTELYWDGSKVYQTNGTGWWYWDYVNLAWVSTSNPVPSSTALPAPIASTGMSLVYDLSGKIAAGTLTIASNASTTNADLYGGLWYEGGFDLSAGHAYLQNGLLYLNSSFNLSSINNNNTHGFTIPAMASLGANGYYVEFIVAYNSLGGDGGNGGHPGMGVWLEGINHVTGTYPASEEDVQEDYGTSANPGNFVATLHDFTSQSTGPQVQIYDNPGQDTTKFHKYAMWAKAGVRHYYLDDVEVPNSPLTPYSVNDTDKHFVVLTAEGPI